MGLLISRLAKLFQEWGNNPARILMLGLDAAGESSFSSLFSFNYFLASGTFYRLLITFAQPFDTLILFLKEFLKKLIADKKSPKNYLACKGGASCCCFCA